MPSGWNPSGSGISFGKLPPASAAGTASVAKTEMNRTMRRTAGSFPPGGLPAASYGQSPPDGSGRRRQRQDLDHADEEQHGAEQDQAEPHAARREVAADADEEEHAREDHRRPHVVVARPARVLALGVE